MNTTPTFGFVLEFVTNIEESRRFYADVLGLGVRREHPDFVQFDNFAITTGAFFGRQEPPALYWLVDNAAAAYGDVCARTRPSIPLTPMPFGHLFAVDDPDGMRRFVLQLTGERRGNAV